MEESRISLMQKARVFVKEKRLARGESQKQFAKNVFGDEKKQDWVSRIENGRGLKLETLDKILAKLNCDIDFIEN